MWTKEDTSDIPMPDGVPYPAMPDTCADPGIFVRGGPGQSDNKKSSDVVFFSFSPQLILQKSNG